MLLCRIPAVPSCRCAASPLYRDASVPPCRRAAVQPHRRTTTPPPRRCRLAASPLCSLPAVPPRRHPASRPPRRASVSPYRRASPPYHLHAVPPYRRAASPLRGSIDELAVGQVLGCGSCCFGEGHDGTSCGRWKQGTKMDAAAANWGPNLVSLFRLGITFSYKTDKSPEVGKQQQTLPPFHHDDTAGRWRTTPTPRRPSGMRCRPTR